MDRERGRERESFLLFCLLEIIFQSRLEIFYPLVADNVNEDDVISTKTNPV